MLSNIFSIKFVNLCIKYTHKNIKLEIHLRLTDLIVLNNSSSFALHKALSCTAATMSGCKFLIAATATLETAWSYSNAYHLCWSSCTVNRHENFVPKCTVFKSFVCCTPIINAKSSVGFQRPKSLVAIWFCCRPFLLRLLLLEIDLPDGLRLGSTTVEVLATGAGGCGACWTTVGEYSKCWDCVRDLPL